MKPVSRRVRQAEAFTIFFTETYRSARLAKELVDKIRQRARLRDALKDANKIKRLEQAHHVIPIEALMQSRLVQKAVMGGFNINGLENGIAFTLRRHKSLHAEWGSYNRLVMQELFNLEARFGNCDQKTARREVRKLITFLRTQL